MDGRMSTLEDVKVCQGKIAFNGKFQSVINLDESSGGSSEDSPLSQTIESGGNYAESSFCQTVEDDGSGDDYINEIPGIRTCGVRRACLKAREPKSQVPHSPWNVKRKSSSRDSTMDISRTKKIASSPGENSGTDDKKSVILAPGSPDDQWEIQWEKHMNDWEMTPVTPLTPLEFGSHVDGCKQQLMVNQDKHRTSQSRSAALTEQLQSLGTQCMRQKAAFEALVRLKDEMAWRHAKDTKDLKAGFANERKQWEIKLEKMRMELIEIGKRDTEITKESHSAEIKMIGEQNSRSAQEMKDRHQKEVEALKSEFSLKESKIIADWTACSDQLRGEKEKLAEQLETLHRDREADRKAWIELLTEKQAFDAEARKLKEKWEPRLKMAEDKLLGSKLSASSSKKGRLG